MSEMNFLASELKKHC